METVIEIQAFGDFDIKYTECIMVSDEKHGLKTLLKEFYEIEGITSTHGNDYKKLNAITNNFIAFLQLKGFKKLKTKEIYFCD